ncbi:MAG: BolA family transcriptional regulator [Planctomycetota bacterium]|nr:MAG: BolA family transcriptional regulator [Planctomycetota bacterium]
MEDFCRDLTDWLHRLLRSSLNPTYLKIVDETHLHRGHSQARRGGHFRAVIVSDVFSGKSLLQRHRLVYQALGSAMGREIHAFSMKVFSPEEFRDHPLNPERQAEPSTSPQCKNS